MARSGIFGIRLHHPAQVVVAAFGVTILAGASLLMLPIATAGPGSTRPITALFTATSAVCVTGLVTVDTPTYWSGFGQGVIMLLIQLGGFGIMTLASLAAIFVSHKLGLRSRLLARAETGTLDLGDVRSILFGIIRFTLLFEGAAALLLTLRFWISYDEGLLRAVWLGVFHAISAFNNAGFALFSDNLMGFAGDELLLLVIGAAVVSGGLGFPVWLDLRNERTRFTRWSLHTKLVVTMTAALLLVGMVTLTAFEWDNPETLGDRSAVDTVANGTFASLTPRTAGFNTFDYGEANDETILVTTLLMFIGAGPASTGGGVKVTTAAVLALMVWAELRGDPDVNRFSRRIPATAQRQALSVVLIGLTALFAGNLLLTATSPFSIGETLFEATSAFGTVGLSTGITGLLADPPQAVLVVLMFLGRVGPLTLGTALVLRERDKLFRYPEERPIIG
nr:potassium transporter TrkG [Actinomarinicola tropica]